MQLNLTTFLVASIWVVAISASYSIDGRASCPGDYTPCTCDQSANGGSLSVTCDKVPIADVQAAFARNPARDISLFSLAIAPSETSPIPADLLSNSHSDTLIIDCSASSYNLLIDDFAFRASMNFTTSMTIDGCDMNQQPNFSFLNGFNNMYLFFLHNSMNIKSFKGFPSQSNLYYLSIFNTHGFQELDDSTVSLPGLQLLYLYGNELNDIEAEKILKNLAGSSTQLNELRLYDNKLTRIPEQISSFSMLTALMMERNDITVISTRSLAFFGFMGYLSLGENAIATIEPSAFGGGYFSGVYLNQNKLTRLDSYVFQVMLEGMSGSLSLHQNPIVCDCHLAWLIVHKRDLLNRIDGGQCSNSTLFRELNPESFRDCPVFTCPAGIDGNFPNPLSCGTFYQCSAGTSYLSSCPDGLVFNPAYQVCDWPYNVPTCHP